MRGSFLLPEKMGRFICTPAKMKSLTPCIPKECISAAKTLRSLAQGALLELLRQGKGWQDAGRRRWPNELPRGSTQECPQARSRGNRLLTGNLARGLGLDDRALHLQRFHLLRGAGADSRQRRVQERLKCLLNFVIHLRGPLGQVEVEV